MVKNNKNDISLYKQENIPHFNQNSSKDKLREQTDAFERSS